MEWGSAVRVAAVIGFLASCGRPPIGVVRLDMDEAGREVAGSLLTTGKISPQTAIELQTRGFAQRYRKEPAAVLAELHQRLLASPSDDRLLFALAELSFDHAVHGGGGRRYFLASAVYAWEFLFGETVRARVATFDGRPRRAANLYNLGLARSFASIDGKNVRVAGGTRKLPFGTIDVAFDPSQLFWGGRKLVRFTSASELDVRGLRNRYRTLGIGAPLNAATRAVERSPEADLVLPAVRVPVTMLLRIEEDASSLATGRLRGRLEIHTTADADHVAIDGTDVPLEIDPTAAFAQMLAESPIWARERAGFLAGDVLPWDSASQLGALEPYRPERIPVVLIHGTVSSAARWAQMVNDLGNEPEIRRRFQLWAFTYSTSSPILYSAMQLRETLGRTVDALDPAGTNACLRQMVLVGHSQGGLLARLMVSESGNRFWQYFSPDPFEQIVLTPASRDLLRRVAFFSPVPFVRRVVFLATPHQGSYVAGGLIRGLVHRLVRLPSNLVSAGEKAAAENANREIAGHLRRLPTSVDNMAPGSPFMDALADVPIAPGVAAHSIVAVKGDGPVETGGDGVVRYASAHLDGVDSEVVVRSAHSCQGNPRTIEEVRRILHEHAVAAFDGDRCRPPDD